MGIFRNIYRMSPIDYWGKAIPLETAYGMLAPDIKEEVERIIWNIEQEIPHTIMCGVVANPENFNFELVVYAKVTNNGSVYVFTNAELISEQIDKLSIEGGY